MSAVLRGRRRYHTTAEAARILGVTTKTVERWCRSGRLRTRDGRRPYQVIRSSVEQVKQDRGRG